MSYCRWFHLKYPMLHYYEDEDEKKEKGKINLHKCTEVRMSTHEKASESCLAWPTAANLTMLWLSAHFVW